MIAIVSFAAVIRVVTQRFSPTKGEKRCVTTLITAAKETMIATDASEMFLKAFEHA